MVEDSKMEISGKLQRLFSKMIFYKRPAMLESCLSLLAKLDLVYQVKRLRDRLIRLLKNSPFKLAKLRLLGVGCVREFLGVKESEFLLDMNSFQTPH